MPNKIQWTKWEQDFLKFLYMRNEIELLRNYGDDPSVKDYFHDLYERGFDNLDAYRRYIYFGLSK